jgi:hypothetical protein
MEELLQRHAEELRRAVLRRPVELTPGERPLSGQSKIDALGQIRKSGPLLEDKELG